jgi:hypothetical protein
MLGMLNLFMSFGHHPLPAGSRRGRQYRGPREGVASSRAKVVSGRPTFSIGPLGFTSQLSKQRIPTVGQQLHASLSGRLQAGIRGKPPSSASLSSRLRASPPTEGASNPLAPAKLWFAIILIPPEVLEPVRRQRGIDRDVGAGLSDGIFSQAYRAEAINWALP